ncbi:sulfotransferase family protein [Jatrophihabitans sp.]|uniref:sulfotransferase family protein n=1 Tax=Jatrophihabitans sp. TaxID=1932789 RepID=UPI002CB00315|nr:sulfotransferase [Jatrophihabitans sp.]
MSAPILILAAGQRCGSTLVQRLLSSHPKVLIWGEHAGQLREVLAVGERLTDWTAEHGELGRLGYARSGHQSFMANLTPEAGAIDDAVRAFVEVLFAQPAADLGRPVWGFKEVRYGLAEARAFRRLFPDCRVVHITRNPRDILRSLEVWERGEWKRADTEIAIRDWTRVGASFWPAPDLPPWVLRVRYEDLVADPAHWSVRFAEHCGLEEELLDRRVFDRRIHAVGLGGRVRRTILDWADLPASLRALLDDDEVRRVARACGYSLDDDSLDGDSLGDDSLGRDSAPDGDAGSR